jgi:hypothetical protein
MLPEGWDRELSAWQIEKVLEVEELEVEDLMMPVTHPKGYVRVRIPSFHPYSTKAGSQYLHRYVMMKHLGRRLGFFEHVHHITLPDGTVAPRNTTNISELMVMEAADHGLFHYGKWIRCNGHVVHCCEDGCEKCDHTGVIVK